MFNYSNLKGIQQNLAVDSKISQLYDPIDFKIHSDSVFIHYENNNFIRLFSKRSLLGLQEQLNKCRQIIKEGERDKSFIKLALNQYRTRNEEEGIYEEILQQMVGKGFDINHIMKSCEVIDTVILILVNMPANANIALASNDLPKNMVFMVPYLTRLYQLRVNQQEELEHSTEVEHQSISTFLEELIVSQITIIDESRKKLLSSTGEALNDNQVLCPFSRSIINVEKSLASASKAKLFLQLIVAAVKINNLQDKSIDKFLKKQKPNYLVEAYQALNHYITKPSTIFTSEQQKFLADIGIKKVVNARYKHLWNKNKSVKDNALAVLNDYSKLNTILPTFSLFMTGHWNRHHHLLVKKAISRIKEDDASIKQVIVDLEEQSRASPKFNPSGSLARRLEFISSHLNELNELTKKMQLR
ncbi:DUF5617 domain-containing protein [Legionella sp. CNM-1927-20]|uniref:DUF5617 domain-containing protein n=1 Tax=Legionella sp. CNM-1927-20 TaxID=3422221 RepID=UPI00403B2D48